MFRSLSPMSRATVALAASTLLVATGCGTRMNKSEIAANNPGRQVSPPTVHPVVPGGFVGDGGADSITDPSASATTRTGLGGGSLGSGATSGGSLAGGAGEGAHPGGDATGGGPAGSGAAAGGDTPVGAGGQPTGGGSASSQGVPCTAEGAPVVIGQGGAFSGVIGQSTGDLKLGLAVWAKWVNDNGGVQCHPVVLYQQDDGSDPSRVAANINDLVRTKHAVALVGMNIPVTISAASKAASQLGVPIVGGDLADVAWFTDPNLFPNGGYSLSSWGGAVIQASAATGYKKFGLLYCVEATICQSIHQNFEPMTKAAKGTIAYQQSVSLTQPDFTAECQNAKNAGVQILAAHMDAAASQRLARSCLNIGYAPVLETGGLAISSTVLEDANIRKLGLFVGDGNATFLSTGTPAMKTMHDAFKKYTGNDVPDQPALKGWASGMLFKAALDQLGPAARSGPITTEIVYGGLYKLKNETLGGLQPPMTYVNGKPAPKNFCYSTFTATSSGVRNVHSGYRCNPM